MITNETLHEALDNSSSNTGKSLGNKMDIDSCLVYVNFNADI